MKEKACAKTGIFSSEHRLPADTSEADLLKLVGQLNQDGKIHGILVQLPLPKQIDENKVEAALRNGVLTVTVPRTAEAAKGRKTIPINAG